MRHVSAEYLKGLHYVVMTNSASLLSSTKGKFESQGRRFRAAEANGIYSGGSIYLVMDRILRPYPEALLLVPIFKAVVPCTKSGLSRGRCLPQRRKDAKKPLVTRQRFAPLRETFYAKQGSGDQRNSLSRGRSSYSRARLNRLRELLMRTEAIKKHIIDNGEEIRRLKARIKETYSNRGKFPGATPLWEQACAEFHARYDSLAFPGGYDTAPQRIIQGDPEAIEVALCFVEIRPYFHGSGYMFETLMRKLKRAPLSEKQSERFATVLRAYHEWRQKRREGKQ